MDAEIKRELEILEEKIETHHRHETRDFQKLFEHNKELHAQCDERLKELEEAAIRHTEQQARLIAHVENEQGHYTRGLNLLNNEVFGEAGVKVKVNRHETLLKVGHWAIGVFITVSCVILGFLLTKLK